MSKENKNGFGKFLAGAAIGAGLGILFAPKKGSQTRKELKVMLDDMVVKIRGIDVEEVKEEFFDKVEEIKDELEDLDKEKVLKLAKKKSEDLKKKSEELIALAKEKGTPVLEKTANDVREKSIEVIKDVLEKLEDTKKTEDNK